MFYCNECSAKKQWPQTLAKSDGYCEICGKYTACNSKPSSQLPMQSDMSRLNDAGFGVLVDLGSNRYYCSEAGKKDNCFVRVVEGDIHIYRHSQTIS